MGWIARHSCLSLMERPVGSVSRHRREVRTAVRCGLLFRFEALPVGDEGEQIVLLQWLFIVNECEAAPVNHIAVVSGRFGDSSVQLGLGHRSVLGEREQGETKTAAPERFRSG